MADWFDDDAQAGGGWAARAGSSPMLMGYREAFADRLKETASMLRSAQIEAQLNLASERLELARARAEIERQMSAQRLAEAEAASRGAANIVQYVNRVNEWMATGMKGEPPALDPADVPASLLRHVTAMQEGLRRTQVAQRAAEANSNFAKLHQEYRGAYMNQLFSIAGDATAPEASEAHALIATLETDPAGLPVIKPADMARVVDIVGRYKARTGQRPDAGPTPELLGARKEAAEARALGTPVARQLAQEDQELFRALSRLQTSEEFGDEAESLIAQMIAESGDSKRPVSTATRLQAYTLYRKAREAGAELPALSGDERTRLETGRANLVEAQVQRQLGELARNRAVDQTLIAEYRALVTQEMDLQLLITTSSGKKRQQWEEQLAQVRARMKEIQEKLKKTAPPQAGAPPLPPPPTAPPAPASEQGKAATRTGTMWDIFSGRTAEGTRYKIRRVD